MSILADTNVLLRRTQPGDSSHVLAVESVARLLAAGEVVDFKLQNIAEFWNVATRPIANTVLPNSQAVYREWKRLVVRHGVLGSKVHDAKLVASMNTHGIRRILTFNTSDFVRYDIEAIHPSSLLA